VREVLQALSLQLAAALSLLLIAAALHKLIWSDRSRRASHEFAGVPLPLAGPAVIAISAVELLAGVLLWLPAWRAAAAAVAAMVWGAYLVLMLRSIADGRREVDCGCSLGGAHGAPGLFQAARNSGLILLSASVAVISADGGAAAIAPMQILSGVALLALYCALDQVMALQPLRSGELA
jgi:hypothetical protein